MITLKKITLLTLLLFIPIISYSQYIDGVDVRELKVNIITVTVYSNLHPDNIDLGFGKRIKIKRKTNILMDGTRVRLKTGNDYINFFTEYGYELSNELLKSGKNKVVSGNVISGPSKTYIRIKKDIL